MPDELDTLQEQYFGHEHTTVIEPRKGWHMLDLKELWAYRELLWVLTMRDVKVRYKQTVLGVAWAIIPPVTTMIIFSIIFGGLANIPSEGHPYPVYVYTALLPWTFFANSIGTSGTSLISSAHLVSKVYFPRLIIPLSSIGVGLIDLAIAMVILFLLMFYFDIPFGPGLLMVPILVMAVVFMALGVGTLLAALTVTYRDFRYVIPFMIQIWMYVTPVVYPLSLIPESWRWLVALNPMTGLVEAFRHAFLGDPFNVYTSFVSVVVAIAIFLAGVSYFAKVERRFADIV